MKLTLITRTTGSVQKSIARPPEPAIQRQSNEVFLDQAHHRLGPDVRRTASRAGASANAQGRAARAAPDQDGFALRGGLLTCVPNAQEPRDFLEAQLARLRLDQLV